jgi:ABC-2 type transport system ATP-binding protein
VTDAVRLTGVRKRFGRVTALDGLDLAIPRGVVCGMVGPNGAGKTTTFSIAGGFLHADAGSVDLLGEGPFDSKRHAGRITMLPQDCELNPHTPVVDLLAFFAQLQGLAPRAARAEAERVLEMVSLTDRAASKIRQLSHGMRRRVAVAQAFLGNPELVFLDEPTNGLDPDLVLKMRELFRSQGGKRTLIVSSHNLGELEAACDYVVFLEHGRCVKSGSLADVTRRGAMIRVLLEARIALEPLAASLPGIATTWEENTLVLTSASGDAAALNARALPALIAGGARILEVRRGQSLEAVYMDEHISNR